MSYDRIGNFPENSKELGSTELSALGKVWLEKRQELEKNGAFQEFLKKMQREWAIETGIIERLYTWDRGVTEVLIEQGIDANIIAHKGGLNRQDADHVKDLIEDQLAIVEGLFSFIKGDQPLTEHFIRSMHAQFTAHQDSTEAVTSDGHLVRVALEKGVYKKTPNNPRRPDGEMHEYCPPELAQEEMQRLVTWYRDQENRYPTEVKAAWLHHRFTQIHPFQDGNGRVARALASLVFLKDGYFPLVIRDSDRREYIGALESADRGDLKPLVDVFVRRQKEAVLKALGLEQQVQQSKYADQIISSALGLLKDKYAKEQKKLSRVYDYAEDLLKTAEKRFDEIANSLNSQLENVTPPGLARYHANSSIGRSDSGTKHYFTGQIVEVAGKFGYFANLDRYRAWARLSIYTEETFELVLSIHGYGHGDNGIMAASAFTAKRVPREEGGTEPVSTQPAATDLFQFNYVESLESTRARFAEWLESALAIGLAEWKRTLA